MSRQLKLAFSLLAVTTAACSGPTGQGPSSSLALNIFASPFPKTSAWGPNNKSGPTGITAGFYPTQKAYPDGPSGPSGITAGFMPATSAWGK